MEHFFIDIERHGDEMAREALLDAVMGAGRKSVACEALREGNEPAVALVVRDGSGLIGTVRLWPVLVPGAGTVLMLGPIAIDTAQAGRGLGSLLMLEGINRAAYLGWNAIILVGAEAYYQRFGFFPLNGVTMPGRNTPGRRLLGLDLRENALASAVGLVRRCEMMLLAA